MIGNSFSFTICTSTVMYLVCLPTFGITFSCFLIVPGIKLSQQKLKTALCKSLGPNKVYYWRCQMTN